MSRILIATVTAATGLSLLTGCDLIAKAVPTPTASAPAPTSPNGPEPTAGSQAPDTSAPPQGNGSGTYADAKAAADALVAAWHIGDKNAAMKAAESNTVEKVFSSVVDTDAKIQTCVPGSQSGVSYAYDCYYRSGGYLTHFYVNPYAQYGWRVVEYKQDTY
jgi:hypothetical protein